MPLPTEPSKNHKCEVCGAPTATYNEQLTNYPDEKDNFCWLCRECQPQIDRYWRQHWRPQWPMNRSKHYNT